MSFSFPKEIIITEEFTLRDETGNSITFNTNGSTSSATSAGGIVTRTVNDPKFMVNMKRIISKLDIKGPNLVKGVKGTRWFYVHPECLEKYIE